AEADATTGTDAVDATAEAATDGTETPATAQADLATVLTPDGFDADALIVYVDESDMNAVAKTTLKAGIEQARDNPTLIPALLEQLKARLGIE
ncbi:MAG: hypothetical protein WBA02_08815, partial [Jannaschia helgolandensis]